ncbi:MAG: DUF523 domain-containing protein [Vicinamibacterales bacterium]
MDAPLRIGISRCLLGDLVRYDGGHKHVPSLVEWLAAHAEVWPICPEVEIGMGTPREPVELQRSPNGVPSGEHRVRLVGVETGTTWTTRMHDWAARQASRWAGAGVSGAVLKSGSPSCGVTGVPVHSGTLRLSGRGLFAEALAAAMPGLPMVEEGDLQDAVARQAFLAAVRAYRTR